MNIDLSGKVVIVTGAGRGIGREIAETFAREGAVTIATDVGQADLNDLHSTFTENQWIGDVFACDVCKANDIARLVETVIARRGRIDVLVNNAGVLVESFIADTTEEAWDKNVDVNLKGTFLMCRAVIPQMKTQKSGRILNAASFAAIIPSLGSGAYAASKAGVHYFTRVLAGELGPWSITANCYAPGMIPTELNHFTDATEEKQEQLLDTLTLRRWGHAREVAHLLCFLASDYAGYITGTLIDVSGGKLATQIPRVAYDLAEESGNGRFL